MENKRALAWLRDHGGFWLKTSPPPPPFGGPTLIVVSLGPQSVALPASPNESDETMLTRAIGMLRAKLAIGRANENHEHAGE